MDNGAQTYVKGPDGMPLKPDRKVFRVASLP